MYHKKWRNNKMIKKNSKKWMVVLAAIAVLALTVFSTVKITLASAAEARKELTDYGKRDFAPVLEVSSFRHLKGEDFNPMNLVRATDREDGDLTSQIKVDDSELNELVTGEWPLTYSVTDSYGNTTVASVIVKVYN